MGVDNNSKHTETKIYKRGDNYYIIELFLIMCGSMSAHNNVGRKAGKHNHS